MKALNELSRLAFEVHKAKYPEIPEGWLAQTKYSDKTASGLTKCVLHWIRLNGGQAERINTTGRPVDRRRVVSDVLGHRRQIGSLTWLPTAGTRGSADVSAIIQGKSVKIEIKIGRDKQSEYQKIYQADVERSGGLYLIVKDFQGFYDWYNKMFK